MNEMKYAEPRLLITSNSHQHYDQVGKIVKDNHDHLVVELNNGQTCRVDNGQFKMIRS